MYSRLTGRRRWPLLSSEKRVSFSTTVVAALFFMTGGPLVFQRGFKAAEHLTYGSLRCIITKKDIIAWSSVWLMVSRWTSPPPTTPFVAKRLNGWVHSQRNDRRGNRRRFYRHIWWRDATSAQRKYIRCNLFYHSSLVWKNLREIKENFWELLRD